MYVHGSEEQGCRQGETRGMMCTHDVARHLPKNTTLERQSRLLQQYSLRKYFDAATYKKLVRQCRLPERCMHTCMPLPCAVREEEEERPDQRIRWVVSVALPPCSRSSTSSPLHAYSTASLEQKRASMFYVMYFMSRNETKKQ